MRLQHDTLKDMSVNAGHRNVKLDADGCCEVSDHDGDVIERLMLAGFHPAGEKPVKRVPIATEAAATPRPALAPEDDRSRPTAEQGRAMLAEIDRQKRLLADADEHAADLDAKMKAEKAKATAAKGAADGLRAEVDSLKAEVSRLRSMPADGPVGGGTADASSTPVGSTSGSEAASEGGAPTAEAKKPKSPRPT